MIKAKKYGIIHATKKAAKQMISMLPILFGVLFLISLITVLIPASFYPQVFTGDTLFDPFIGGVFGSISAGIPIVSYIVGGELLKNGVSLLAVTAFLVSWVTVGLVQLPYEIKLLGRRFALLRNLLGFIFSILVAITTVMIITLVN